MIRAAVVVAVIAASGITAAQIAYTATGLTRVWWAFLIIGAGLPGVGVVGALLLDAHMPTEMTKAAPAEAGALRYDISFGGQGYPDPRRITRS